VKPEVLCDDEHVFVEIIGEVEVPVGWDERRVHYFHLVLVIKSVSPAQRVLVVEEGLFLLFLAFSHLKGGKFKIKLALLQVLNLIQSDDFLSDIVG